LNTAPLRRGRKEGREKRDRKEEKEKKREEKKKEEKEKNFGGGKSTNRTGDVRNFLFLESALVWTSGPKTSRIIIIELYQAVLRTPTCGGRWTRLGTRLAGTIIIGSSSSRGRSRSRS